MNQLKKIGQVIVAQRFWLICGIVVCLPLVGWLATTAGMRSMTQDRKTKITSKFKEADSLRNKQDPPNDTSHKEMEKLIAATKERVRDVWQSQYDRQINLLVWPAGLNNPEFLRVVQTLSPFEKVKYGLTSDQEPLAPALRDLYRNHIKNELPKLANIIDAQWMGGMPAGSTPEGASGAAGAGFGLAPNPSLAIAGASLPGAVGGAATPSSDRSKVQWNAADQAKIWSRYNWSGFTPRTLDVLYAQEDLWIMTALLQIIAETNKSATGRYNAIVKDLHFIEFGRDAIDYAQQQGKGGKVTRVKGGLISSAPTLAAFVQPESSSASAEASAFSMSGAGGGESAFGGMTGASGVMPGGSAASGAAMMQGDPASRRYVNSNYEAIAADKLREAIELDTQNEADAFLLVAKRIPIRLGITVDQRKLNHLIAACGNSPLMVEIRQVRFNRGPGAIATAFMGMSSSAFGATASTAGGASGGSRPGSGGRGGLAAYVPEETHSDVVMFGGGSAPSSGSSGSSGSTQNSRVGPDMTPHDKPVELFGVVYIYNPVDVRKLRLEEGAVAAPPAKAALPPQSEPGD